MARMDLEAAEKTIEAVLIPEGKAQEVNTTTIEVVQTTDGTRSSFRATAVTDSLFDGPTFMAVPGGGTVAVAAANRPELTRSTVA